MTASWRLRLLNLAAPLTALVVSVVASSLILLLTGSNPITAFGDILSNGFKLTTLIDMLNRATPLYLSGIAAAIGFRMNLFNIGVEGQYLLAGFVAAVAGAAVSLPGILHVALILVVAMAVGAAWAGIAGWLKTSRGINEVISTIMLNAIAASGLVAPLLVRFREGELSTNSGTKEIAESGWIPNLNFVFSPFDTPLKGRELNGMLVIAIVVGIVYYLIINRSVFGFDLRASGANPEAAKAGGVPPKRMIVVAMVLSGAVAGLVGMAKILGETHRFDNNFSTGLGFAGIAVALLGRNTPFGVAIAAFIFAFLDAASPILQITGSASPEIVTIMQGIILLVAVIAYEAANRIKLREEIRLATLGSQEAVS